MHVEHVDALVVGERGKADGRAVVGRDQRQFAGKPRAEFLLVVGRRRPRLLLRLAVIVGGQFLDAGAENLRQIRHVPWQHRPHRELRLGARGHATLLSFQVVVPSLWSSSSTPIVASSSRMRSDSLKFLVLRATERASIRSTILASSIAIRVGRNAFHSAEDRINSPISCALAFRHAAADLAPLVASARNSCKAANAFGVLRSSASAWTVSAHRYPGARSAVSAYQ